MTVRNKTTFAFLVHPRSLTDVFRKYPLLKFFPRKLVEFTLMYLWPPVIVSRVTGLHTINNNEAIDGYVISIPMTARQMMEHRDRARRKIVAAARLAKKKGVAIIGLGGLTSSLTGGGLEIIDKVEINVTTGHAYTAYNVTKNILELSKILKVDKKKVILAIVGAAGSVGSTSAKILARAGYNNIILIDLERKHRFFKDLMEEMKEINPGVIITTSHKIRDIKTADFIVTATNTPEALIKSEDLKPGAVVVDDAQPSDISPEVFTRFDVLAVEAGVVHTPGVKSNFNIGLKDEFDNFCCMAELLILASHEWDDHYVINRATLSDVDEVAEWGKDLGFKLGHFQNPVGVVSGEKIENVRRVIQERDDT